MATVLVVDDEIDIVEVLQHILKQEGYVVITATNGQECLSILQTFTPDVVLLDMMMPLMDGRGVLTAMRADERFCDVPVILMSAGDALSLGRELGLHALRKPFSVEVLVETIQKVSAARTASMLAPTSIGRFW